MMHMIMLAVSACFLQVKSNWKIFH